MRMRAVLHAAVAAVAAVVMAACASPLIPSSTRPPNTVELAIEVWRAPDPMLDFFGSEVHARLLGDGWSTEWVVPEGKTSTLVPSGAVQLDMWTIVYGDTLECTTDPTSGRELCSQPIIGTGQTCSLTMQLPPEARVSVRFRLLADERCALDGEPV